MESVGLLMQTVSKLKSLLTSLSAALSASNIEQLQELESLISSTINSRTVQSKCGTGLFDSYGDDVVEESVEADATEYVYVEMEIDECISTIDVKPKPAAISDVGDERVVLDEGQAGHYGDDVFESQNTPKSAVIQNLKSLENEMGEDNSDWSDSKTDENRNENVETLYPARRQFKYIIVKYTDEGLEYHCYEESMERETATVICDFKLVPHGSRTYLCGYCDYESSRLHCLKTHIMKHMPKEKFSFQCQLCKKTLGSKKSLNSHMPRHTEEYQTRFKCTFANCGYSCGNPNNFNRHIRRMHTFDKPYTCDDCDKAFITNDERKEHMRIYHNADFKPLDKRRGRSGRSGRPGSGRTTALSRLIKEMPEKPYGCGFCDIRFKTTGELSAHILKCKAKD